MELVGQLLNARSGTTVSAITPIVPRSIRPSTTLTLCYPQKSMVARSQHNFLLPTSCVCHSSLSHYHYPPSVEEYEWTKLDLRLIGSSTTNEYCRIRKRLYLNWTITSFSIQTSWSNGSRISVLIMTMRSRWYVFLSIVELMNALMDVDVYLEYCFLFLLDNGYRLHNV